MNKPLIVECESADAANKLEAEYSLYAYSDKRGYIMKKRKLGAKKE